MFVVGLVEDVLIATSVLQCRRAATLLCCREVPIVLLKPQVPQISSSEEVLRSLVQVEVRVYSREIILRHHKHI